MLTNKLPFIFLLFCLSAANNSSDDENYVANEEEIEDEEVEYEVEEYNDNKNVNIIGEGTSTRSIWKKDRLKQINECQEKLFGKEKPINEYNLNDNSQQIIIDHYKSINKKFKAAAKRYEKLLPHEKRKHGIEVFL